MARRGNGSETRACPAPTILITRATQTALDHRAVRFEAVGRDQRDSNQAAAGDDVVEDCCGVSRGPAADEAACPYTGGHLDRRKQPRRSALAADERVEFVGLQLEDVEVPQPVLRERPIMRAVPEMPTPSTRRLATWSNSRLPQRRPLYAVPVFVLTVPLQTVHRYRCRRPDFVANEP